MTRRPNGLCHGMEEQRRQGPAGHCTVMPQRHGWAGISAFLERARTADGQSQRGLGRAPFPADGNGSIPAHARCRPGISPGISPEISPGPSLPGGEPSQRSPSQPTGHAPALPPREALCRRLLAPFPLLPAGPPAPSAPREPEPSDNERLGVLPQVGCSEVGTSPN